MTDRLSPPSTSSSAPSTEAPGCVHSRPLGGLLRESGLLFETGVLELLVEREPANTEYLAALGQTYARLRRYHKGLAIDRRLVTLRPEDPILRYNLACSQSLTGDLDGATGSLLKALELGYRDFEHLHADDDLDALRRDARFGLVTERMQALQGRRA